MKATISPMKNTERLAMDTDVPDMLFCIPGNPSTTASTTSSTITPATSRMKAGMTGVNAPQLLLDVSANSIHSFRYNQQPLNRSHLSILIPPLTGQGYSPSSLSPKELFSTDRTQ